MSLFFAVKDLMTSLRQYRQARADLPKAEAEAARKIAEAKAQTERVRQETERHLAETHARSERDEAAHKQAMAAIAADHARIIRDAQARNAILTRMEAGEITVAEALVQMRAYPL